MKAPATGDVGDGLAGEAAADEVTQGGAGRLVDVLIEAEVDLHALAAEGLGEQVEGVGAGVVEALAGEAVAGPLQQLGDSPELRARGPGRCVGGHERGGV